MFVNFGGGIMLLNKNNQKGATMMEALAVLTIISMLGMSIIKMIGSVFDMYNQSMITSEIKDLQKAITGKYQFNGTYKALFDGKSADQVAQTLCSEKLAPFKMCVNNKLFHSGKGAVTVEPVKIYNMSGGVIDNYGRYSILFDGLKNKTCMSIASINWAVKGSLILYKLEINKNKDFQGDSEKEALYKKTFDLPNNKTAETFVFPVKPEDVMGACSNKDDNSVKWTFF